MSDGTTILGATTGDDASGLRLLHLTTREARNAAELDFISRAYDRHIYQTRRKRSGTRWLDDAFIRRLHSDMFGEMWKWAGKYRTVPLNLGVEPHLIHEQIHGLCGDFEYWDSPQCKMPVLEIAARLQNRLTRIHPFVNGNGRHARLITDIYLRSVNHPIPEWPQIQLTSQGDKIRTRYIDAMKSADKEDYNLLIAFITDCL